MKNFRDFGCSNVKKGIFLRGESLDKLSSKDRKMLVNKYHLKVVVDLRTTQEHDDKKDKNIPGVSNIHIPLIKLEDMGVSSVQEGQDNASEKQQLPNMFEYYKKMIGKEKKEAWTKIFELLLNHQEGSIFFHCTQGKDRTGMVAAVILTLLGVDKETIYHDYLLTNEHPIIPLVYKLYSLKLKKEIRKQFFNLFYVHQEYLDFAFSQIDEIYGSMDNFYKECCSLDDKKIKQLREKYLEA